MKQFQFLPYVLFVFLLFCCSPTSEKKALEIIEKSVASHGGMKSWKEISFFSFEKETILYDENGNIESQLIQRFEFRHKPFFEGKISWENDNIKHILVFDGIKTRYWMGENEILNEGFLQQQKKVMDATYYVLAKPFDLLEENKHLTYEGQCTLPTGEELYSIDVIDRDSKDVKVDVWTYYFDPFSNELLGYKIIASDHTSFVKNLEFDKDLKIRFPVKRVSYRLNDQGEIQYKRADYEFKNYVIK